MYNIKYLEIVAYVYLSHVRIFVIYLLHFSLQFKTELPGGDKNLYFKPCGYRGGIL